MKCFESDPALRTKNGGDFSLFSSIEREAVTDGEKVKVVIVSNYIEDALYALHDSTRELWQARATDRIRNMVAAIAPEILNRNHELVVEVVNIADSSVREIQDIISNAAMVVFSGGPQNVINTDDAHKEAINNLDTLTSSTIESIKDARQKTQYMLSICLGHQSLGKYLGYEVQQNTFNTPNGDTFLNACEGIEITIPGKDHFSIKGKAFHGYHVKFNESATERKDGLRVVQFATLPADESHRRDALCYGFIVYNNMGDVIAVSTQFHPEASFDEHAPDEGKTAMKNMLVRTFQSRYFPHRSRQPA